MSDDDDYDALIGGEGDEGSPGEGEEGEGHEEEGDQDDTEQLFDDTLNPFDLLERTSAHHGDSAQPYEIMASKKRKAMEVLQHERGGRSKGRDMFGATVDDIWGKDGVASQLGLKPTRRKRRRKSKATGKGGRAGLPEEVTRRLGEANLMYAMSQYAEAAEVLKEVIRLAPNLPDSYHTLGLIYESMGDLKRGLDFYMIAAHLTPKDGGLWKRLAAMSQEQGNARQAIYCLSKVVRMDHDDMDARWDRAVLYAEINEPRKAAESFEAIAAARPGDSDVAKMQARMYHRIGQPAKAIGVLEDQLENYPAESDLTLVNILAELYMEAGSFGDTVKLIDAAVQALCREQALPLDLHVKKGICAAYTGDMQEAARCFGELLDKEDVAQYADLYMDVADTYWALGLAGPAFSFYEALRACPDYDQPGLWARMAGCQRASGQAGAAAETYRAVLADLEPHQGAFAEASVALAELHIDLGELEKAAEVLGGIAGGGEEAWRVVSHGSDAELQLLMRRVRLHLRLKGWAHFLELALPVVLRSLQLIVDPGLSAAARRRAGLGKALEQARRLLEAGGGGAGGNVLFVGYEARDRRKPHVRAAQEAAARAAMEARQRNEDAELLRMRPAPLPGILRDGEQFALLVEVGKALLAHRRLREAGGLVDYALSAGRALDRPRRNHLRFLAAAIAFHDAGGGATSVASAYESVRYVCSRMPRCTAIWNLFSRLGPQGGMARMNKFVTKMRGLHPTSAPLMMLMGHCYSMTGMPAQALGEYFQAARVAPSEPLVPLCIGLAYLQQAMGRRVGDRNRCILQAFAYLERYSDLRGEGGVQEVCYNLGRALHQLGVLYLAAPLYQKALTSAPVPAVEGGEGGGATGSDGGEQPAAATNAVALDLRREAAHNLALIYTASGADQLARQVLREHLTV